MLLIISYAALLIVTIGHNSFVVGSRGASYKQSKEVASDVNMRNSPSDIVGTSGVRGDLSIQHSTPPNPFGDPDIQEHGSYSGARMSFGDVHRTPEAMGHRFGTYRDESGHYSGGGRGHGEGGRSYGAGTHRGSGGRYGDGREGYGGGAGGDASSGHVHGVRSQIHASQVRQLESQNRAMQSIAQSEEIGIATAVQLGHQGEQLNNVERKTTEIKEMQKLSKAHINNLKGVTGGIKNWFTKRLTRSSTREPAGREAGSSSLAEATAESRKAMDAGKKSKSGKQSADLGTSASAAAGRGSGAQQQSIFDDDHERVYAKNMDEISNGMGRLLGLANGLGDEIERQNHQLDRIEPELEKVSTTMAQQNKGVRSILYGNRAAKM